MQCFYIVKLAQASVMFLLVWKIMTTEKLCGNFYNCILDGSNYRCSELTVYQMEPSKLWKYTNESDGAMQLRLDHKWHLSVSFPANHLRNISDYLPTGPACLNISLLQSFSRCLALPTNPFDQLVDYFAVPFVFAIANLVLIAVHTSLQVSPHYNPCEYAVVVFSILIWMVAFACTAELNRAWEQLWSCTNFRPDHEKPFVVYLSLYVSAAMVFSSAFELIFGDALLADMSEQKGRAKRRVRVTNSGHHPCARNGRGNAASASMSATSLTSQAEVYRVEVNR